MLVGYMRVSSDGDRQVMDLQRDALLAAGVDVRTCLRTGPVAVAAIAPGWPRHLPSCTRETVWWSGSWTGSAVRCRIC